jgi:hypothetical protein
MVQQNIIMFIPSTDVMIIIVDSVIAASIIIHNHYILQKFVAFIFVCAWKLPTYLVNKLGGHFQV